MTLSVYLGTGGQERNLQLHTCPLVLVVVEQHAWKSSIIIPSLVQPLPHMCVCGGVCVWEAVCWKPTAPLPQPYSQVSQIWGKLEGLEHPRCSEWALPWEHHLLGYSFPQEVNICGFVVVSFGLQQIFMRWSGILKFIKGNNKYEVLNSGGRREGRID